MKIDKSIFIVLFLLSLVFFIWECQIELFTNEKIKDDVAQENIKKPDIIVKHYYYSTEGVTIDYDSECTIDDIDLAGEESVLIKFKIFNTGSSDLLLTDSNAVYIRIRIGSEEEFSLRNIPANETIEPGPGSYAEFYIRFFPENNEDKTICLYIRSNVSEKNPYPIKLNFKITNNQQ